MDVDLLVLRMSALVLRHGREKHYMWLWVKTNGTVLG